MLRHAVLLPAILTKAQAAWLLILQPAQHPKWTLQVAEAAQPEQVLAQVQEQQQAEAELTPAEAEQAPEQEPEQAPEQEPEPEVVLAVPVAALVLEQQLPAEQLELELVQELAAQEVVPEHKNRNRITVNKKGPVKRSFFVRVNFDGEII